MPVSPEKATVGDVRNQLDKIMAQAGGKDAWQFKDGSGQFISYDSLVVRGARDFYMISPKVKEAGRKLAIILPVGPVGKGATVLRRCRDDLRHRRSLRRVSRLVTGEHALPQLRRVGADSQA